MGQRTSPSALSLGQRAFAGSAVVTATATALFWWLVFPFAGRSLRPPLPDIVLWTGLAAAALTIFLGVATGRRWTRWLYLLLLPVLPAALIVGFFVAPYTVAHARLPDGRQAHLAIAPVPTDVVYDLWVDDGLFFNQINADLDYSEDGRFVGDEKLAVSRDGRRLLVGRGGIWTDCLTIAANFARCDLGLERPISDHPDFETKMRANSAEIAKLL